MIFLSLTQSACYILCSTMLHVTKKSLDSLRAVTFDQVVQLYQTRRHSCCLYLGSVFVGQFGYKPEYQSKLRLMFEV